MNLQGKINLIKLAKEAIRNAIISMGIIPSGNISTYADAITQIDTVNNTSLTVNPSTTSQTLRPSAEYTGYGVVNVNPVTPTIDENIVATNIKNGVEILGVTGSVDELIGQSKTITENGVYIPDSGYTGFTSVIVDTPIGITREVKNGVYQMPSSNFTFSIPDEATDLGTDALSYAFWNRYVGVPLTSIDLSSLTTISGENALGNAFYKTKLTSVDLSNLTTISGINALVNAFSYCSSLTSVDLSNLTTISGNGVLRRCFQYCNSLMSISFPSLTSSSFGSYINQFNEMLIGITGCTVHFPSNLQSVIGSWADVVAGFGGTNTTVLFDLPATT